MCIRDRPYLFISNHRDIAMDPAFVNWVLYQNGFKTLRIAIGDNLLTKPFASDLMRLNKCFIVNRSATSPREKLKAAKKLSAYMHHSLTQDKSNLWIAQREGRAKDSLDITNPAIISMLALNKPKQEAFGDYIASLNIVPVSISSASVIRISSTSCRNDVLSASSFLRKVRDVIHRDSATTSISIVIGL